MTDWKDNEDVGEDYPDRDDEEPGMNYEELREYLDELYAKRDSLEGEMQAMGERLDAVMAKCDRIEDQLEEMEKNGDGT